MIQTLRTMIFIFLLVSIPLTCGELVSGHVKMEGSISLNNASVGSPITGNVSRDKEEIWFFSYNNSQENQVRRMKTVTNPFQCSLFYLLRNVFSFALLSIVHVID